MKNTLFFLTFLSGSLLSFGQNLVIDGSLEDTIKCPLSIGRFYHPTNTTQQYLNEWRSTTLASPDYHNLCGYDQFEPRTGDGYAGLLYYDPSEFREYITALLSEPLIAGERYYVEYYVALSEGSTRAVDEVQVHFADEVPLDLTFPIDGPLDLTSHVDPETTPVSNDYQKISTCYTAFGGEETMTFGNFNDNASTTLTTVSSVGSVNAYYYIDDVSIIWFDTSVTNSGTSLSANLDEATSYQWLDCHSGYTPIDGAINQEFEPSLSGTYAVIVGLGDCVDTSACHHIELNGGGVGMDEYAKLLKLVPNPTDGFLKVEFEGVIDQVRVYDALGRTVLETTAEMVDLTVLESGVYYVGIKSEGRWIVDQVVKK